MASSSAVDNRPRIDVGMAALECAPAVPHEVLLSCSLPMALVHPESLDVIQVNGEFASINQRARPRRFLLRPSSAPRIELL